MLKSVRRNARIAALRLLGVIAASSIATYCSVFFLAQLHGHYSFAETTNAVTKNVARDKVVVTFGLPWSSELASHSEGRALNVAELDDEKRAIRANCAEN